MALYLEYLIRIPGIPGCHLQLNWAAPLAELASQGTISADSLLSDRYIFQYHKYEFGIRIEGVSGGSMDCTLLQCIDMHLGISAHHGANVMQRAQIKGTHDYIV
jgi:hypothetical protein